MNGYGVIVKSDDFIYNVFLVDAEDNVPPIDSIQRHCGSCWDEYRDLIEWFTVKDVERLKAIDWPEQGSDDDRDIQQLAKIQIYRAFEIKPVTLIQALDSLGNEVITKATGLGWSPLGIGPVLHLLAWSMNEADQAEAYREDIMDMADDIELAVSSTESIYESDAYQFLEEEMEARSESSEPMDIKTEDTTKDQSPRKCSRCKETIGKDSAFWILRIDKTLRTVAVCSKCYKELQAVRDQLAKASDFFVRMVYEHPDYVNNIPRVIGHVVMATRGASEKELAKFGWEDSWGTEVLVLSNGTTIIAARDEELNDVGALCCIDNEGNTFEF